jgi:uncharacterized protein YjbI with pentapeptide repeats
MKYTKKFSEDRSEVTITYTDNTLFDIKEKVKSKTFKIVDGEDIYKKIANNETIDIEQKYLHDFHYSKYLKDFDSEKNYLIHLDSAEGSFFEDVDFSGAKFGEGDIDFSRAQFGEGNVDFSGAKFGGGNVDFIEAQFGEGNVDFSRAQFGEWDVDFSRAQFGEGNVDFSGSKFGEGNNYFLKTQFGEGNVDFSGAKFGEGKVFFSGPIW